LAALVGMASPADAVTFLGGYELILAPSAEDVIETQLLLPGGALEFTLEQGESATFDLFTIHSSATELEALDGHPISIDFRFIAPEPFGSAVAGATMIHNFYGLMQWGQLVWENGGIKWFEFDGGRLLVELGNANFNKGLYGLAPGADHQGIVPGTFSFVAGVAARTDTPPPQSTPVPEPASWAMMIAGFGAVGLALRRRRRKAQPAFSCIMGPLSALVPAGSSYHTPRRGAGMLAFAENLHAVHENVAHSRRVNLRSLEGSQILDRSRIEDCEIGEKASLH
jgi:hypothetical protein